MVTKSPYHSNSLILDLAMALTIIMFIGYAIFDDYQNKYAVKCTNRYNILKEVDLPTCGKVGHTITCKTKR